MSDAPVPADMQWHKEVKREAGVGSGDFIIMSAGFFFLSFFSIYYLAASGLRCSATCGILVAHQDQTPSHFAKAGSAPGPSGSLSRFKKVKDLV